MFSTPTTELAAPAASAAWLAVVLLLGLAGVFIPAAASALLWVLQATAVGVLVGGLLLPGLLLASHARPNR